MNMHSTHAELHMDSPADLDGLPDLLLARLHDQGIAAQVNATPKGTVVVDFDVSGEPNAAAAAWCPMPWGMSPTVNEAMAAASSKAPSTPA